VLAITSCAAPMSFSDMPLSRYDKNTEYGIKDRTDGFDIAVLYSKYELIPASDAVAMACKSSLTSIAWEVSEKKGRQIAPINEQTIKISMGRNGLSGMTSCRAFATAKWK